MCLHLFRFIYKCFTYRWFSDFQIFYLLCFVYKCFTFSDFYGFTWFMSAIFLTEVLTTFMYFNNSSEIGSKQNNFNDILLN